MEPTQIKPVPIFFLSLSIIFIIVSSFFLVRKNPSVPPTPPEPQEIAGRILSGTLAVDPSADLTHCPAFPSSSYQITNTRTEETNALSYVTVSFSQPEGQHYYQLILLAAPPPWKLAACRDLGSPVLLQTQ